MQSGLSKNGCPGKAENLVAIQSMRLDGSEGPVWH